MSSAANRRLSVPSCGPQQPGGTGSSICTLPATHLFPHDQSPTGVGFVFGSGADSAEIHRTSLAGKPRSSGSPYIDLNFLAQESDRVACWRVKPGAKIGQTAPLSTLIHSELAPLQTATRPFLPRWQRRWIPIITRPLPRRWKCRRTEGGRRPSGPRTRRIRASGRRRIHLPRRSSVATNVTTIATAEHIARHYA